MEFEIEDGVLVRYNGQKPAVIVEGEFNTIGMRAFADNDVLEQVTIGGGIQEIKEEAFSNCHHLKEVCFSNGVKKIGCGAFARCISLKKIELPESLTELDGATFNDCENLKRVVIPEGVQRIEDFALTGFRKGVPLEELILPDSVEYLGEHNISYNGGGSSDVDTSGRRWSPYPKSSGDMLFKRVHLGKGLKTIGSHAPNYYVWEKIDFLSDFALIFDKKYSDLKEASRDDGKLYTDFSVDTANPYYKYEAGFLLSKDGKILYSCMIDNAKDIVVPDSVEKIMGHAFSYVCCGTLVIHGGIQYMKGAFVNARIDKLVLSEGITETQDQVFLKSHIKELSLPRSLLRMQGNAFLETRDLRILRLYKGIEFARFRPMYPKGTSFKDMSPFWFDKYAGFNDLEFVELLDETGHVISRLGIPTPKEKSSLLDQFHFLLDDFIVTDGHPNEKALTKLFSLFKDKHSRYRIMYGLLTSESIQHAKIREVILPEIIKCGPTLLRMASQRGDKETMARIEELINI